MSSQWKKGNIGRAEDKTWLCTGCLLLLFNEQSKLDLGTAIFSFIHSILTYSDILGRFCRISHKIFKYLQKHLDANR